MVRDGKPKGLFSLDHRTVNGKLAIITDTYVTPANVHDSNVYLSRLDRQQTRFGFDVGADGLDAGYAAPSIAKALEDRQILGVTGCRNPTPPKPVMMRKSTLVFEPETDGYRCPEGQLLTYSTTDRNLLPALHIRPGHLRQLPAVGLLHLECQGNPHRHLPCLGRRPRTH